MDRARIFGMIDVAGGRGLEIGPLNKPIITRAMGPVEYIDRATREDLQAWYAGDPNLNPDDIVHVDHVWTDQKLIDVVGGQRLYDYLLGSHVIEHAPDLIGWLGEIAGVLADGGQAVFIVPDKRHTFDIDRRPSGGAELVDAHLRGLRRPDTRQIFDNFHYFRDPDTGLNRDGQTPTEAAATQSAREILGLCRHIQDTQQYIDAHCWVFTPRSMVELLDLISRLDLLAFEIARLEAEPGTNEFLLILRRLPDDLTPEARRAAFIASRKALDLPAEALTPEEAEAMLREAQLRLDEAHGRLDEAHRALEAARHTEARLAAIEASTSWRLTAPLRGLVGLLRGGKP
jgi:hypothetical protein